MNWKTYAGAAIVAVSGALEGLAVAYPEHAYLSTIGNALLAAGTALGLVGLRHAISKTTK